MDSPTSFAPILLSWFKNRDHLVDAVRGSGWATDHASPAAAPIWRAYAAPDLVRWRTTVGPIAQILSDRGVRLPAGGTVLDLGCGSAVVALTLARVDVDARVVAVDRVEVLDVVRELAADMGVKAEVQCVPSDARLFRPDPESVDVVLLGNVAQYLTDDELIDVLSGVRKALRPGGILHLTTPVVDDGSDGWAANWSSAVEMFLSSPRVPLRDDSHVRRTLAAAGFDAITYWPPHAYTARVG
jgi:SAM-dependent methyltransferase